MLHHTLLSIGSLGLPGDLCTHDPPAGIVVFAHGSGSSRFSRRNRRVAETLQRGGLGTLLFDLLTPDEAEDRDPVFDIGLLAQRLLDALDALPSAAPPQPVGLFGASTGAAAALVAAALRPDAVRAVVSRGGRPDLAAEYLDAVRAATLLIVGGADTEVLALNRAAYARLCCDKRIDVVAGATHLFEEAGAIETVARLARDWFRERLAPMH